MSKSLDDRIKTAQILRKLELQYIENLIIFSLLRKEKTRAWVYNLSLENHSSETYLNFIINRKMSRIKIGFEYWQKDKSQYYNLVEDGSILFAKENEDTIYLPLELTKLQTSNGEQILGINGPKNLFPLAYSQEGKNYLLLKDESNKIISCQYNLISKQERPQQKTQNPEVKKRLTPRQKRIEEYWIALPSVQQMNDWKNQLVPDKKRGQFWN